MNSFIVSDDTEKFYGRYIYNLKSNIEFIINQLQIITKKYISESGKNPIRNIQYRIKTPGSMAEKLIGHGYEVTPENAVTKVYDAAGLRIVTNQMDDVAIAAEMIRHIHGIEIIGEKDYISRPKKSGYRSYHIICSRYSGGILTFAEIQIRTVNMDIWAAIDHETNYKKNNAGGGHPQHQIII